MKTNVAIELSDDDRSLLANMIDGKVTKRLATRADIVRLCQLSIAGLTEQSNASVFQTQAIDDPEATPYAHPWNTPDEEDQILLQGKEESYVYGWNKAKHS